MSGAIGKRQIGLLLGILLAALPGRGAQLAFDNASQTAYDDGWQSGDNGGLGFGPWSLSGGGVAAVGTSTANGDAEPPQGDIDSSGSRAWSLARTQLSISAARPLIGALEVGQHILLDFDAYPTVGPNGDFFTIDFGNSTVSRWHLFYDVLGPRVFMPGGGVVYSQARSPEGFHLDFTLTGPDTYSATINVLGAPPNLFSGNLDGTAGTSIDRIAVGNGAFIAGNDVFYVNNLVVTPEPCGIIAVVGGLFTVQRRRFSRGLRARR